MGRLKVQFLMKNIKSQLDVPKSKVMMYLKKLLNLNVLLMSLLVIVIATGCSTILTVRSFPDGAEVYMRPMGVQSDKKKVGQTPLSMDLTQFVAAMGFKGPLVVETSKVGYVPKEMMISDAGATDIELNFELKPEVKVNISDKIDNVVDRLFEVQRLAQIGRLQDALTSTQQLKNEFPDMASILEMEGGVLFLMARFDDAFDAFSQASALNPNNYETRNMRDVLAAKLGRRVPSSETEAKPKSPGAALAPTGNSPATPPVELPPAGVPVQTINSDAAPAAGKNTPAAEVKGGASGQ